MLRGAAFVIFFSLFVSVPITIGAMWGVSLVFGRGLLPAIIFFPVYTALVFWTALGFPFPSDSKPKERAEISRVSFNKTEKATEKKSRRLKDADRRCPDETNEVGAVRINSIPIGNSTNEASKSFYPTTKAYSHPAEQFPDCGILKQRRDGVWEDEMYEYLRVKIKTIPPSGTRFERRRKQKIEIMGADPSFRYTQDLHRSGKIGTWADSIYEYHPVWIASSQGGGEFKFKRVMPDAEMKKMAQEQLAWTMEDLAKAGLPQTKEMLAIAVHYEDLQDLKEDLRK